jgi:hypothetical protein
MARMCARGGRGTCRAMSTGNRHRGSALQATVILHPESRRSEPRLTTRVGPACGGLDFGGPPAARRAPRIGADVGSAQATPILLTRLLTTNLDDHGQGWNCHVAAQRASGPNGQQRPDLDEPDLAKDQKVGVRVPPSAPPYPQVKALFPAIGRALPLCLGAHRLTISHSPKRSCESWRARLGLGAGLPRSRGRKSSA